MWSAKGLYTDRLVGLSSRPPNERRFFIVCTSSGEQIQFGDSFAPKISA